MRKRTFTLALILFLVVFFAFPGEIIASNTPAFADHIIKLQLSSQGNQLCRLAEDFNAESSTFGITELDELAASYGNYKLTRAHIRMEDRAFEEQSGFHRWVLLKYDKPINVEQAQARFKAQKRWVDNATPEHYAHTTSVPNDPLYENNWGHNNTGQLPKYTIHGGHNGVLVGNPGFDARAELAWSEPQGYGSQSIIIAIIDTGADLNHPDLRLVAGYDYGSNDSNPMDDSADAGHGTGCAGIAAAKADNNLGVVGIAGGCSVMPLKVANDEGVINMTAITNAITHARNNRAHIISMSLGTPGMQPGDSPATDDAITYAYNSGLVIFAATGNSNDSTILYPANHEKVISVGAASPTGQRKSPGSSDGELFWGSNYGVNIKNHSASVDIMGPTILPTTDITGSAGATDGDYELWFNGTSCAAPYVAGVAALLKSQNPRLSPAQVRSLLINSATDMTADGGVGWDRYTGYGMVNAYLALTIENPGAPICRITEPTDLAQISQGSTVNIHINARDIDGDLTNLSLYLDGELKYSAETAPFSWAWDTAAYQPGTYTFTATATDDENKSSSHSISLEIVDDLLDSVHDLVATVQHGMDGSNLLLSWSAIQGAQWYVIYISDHPEGDFEAYGYVMQSDFQSYTISIEHTDKAFFRVSAGRGTPPAIMRFEAASPR